MRKWVILLIALAAIGGLWAVARSKWRFVPVWDQPKFEKLTRGDIRVPIVAAGLISPKQQIEIKSKASGEVIEIDVFEGSRVHKGDVMVLLKPDDEKRSEARAQAGLDRATALLAQAKVGIEKAKAAVLIADARIAELEANAEGLKFDMEKEERLSERDQTSPQSLVNARSRFHVNAAQLEAARAQKSSADSSALEAAETVKIQEAAVLEATNVFEDAKERLRETTIRAPSDGLVTGVNVKVGNLVQSGTQSLTGGTAILMLADDSELKCIARVDEADYGRVIGVAPEDSLPEIEDLRRAVREDVDRLSKRTGDVRITVDAFPEESFTGKITRVEPQGKLNQGAAIIQYDVHVGVTDEKRYLLPLGTQAQVEFTVESVKNALLVPAEAVRTHDDAKGFWVPSRGDDGKIKPRFVPVRFGITDGAMTQVIEAIGGGELKEGQIVYTKLPKPPDENQH